MTDARARSKSRHRLLQTTTFLARLVASRAYWTCYSICVGFPSLTAFNQCRPPLLATISGSITLWHHSYPLRRSLFLIFPWRKSVVRECVEEYSCSRLSLRFYNFVKIRVLQGFHGARKQVDIWNKRQNQAMLANNMVISGLRMIWKYCWRRTLTSASL